MKFKIGFTAEQENADNKTPGTEMTGVCRKIVKEPRKSVVDVYFESRNLTCSYYNDMFDLKLGDIVYVDGKLEGHRGRVVDINYTFKIKLSDYKRVIGVADTSVEGKVYLAGSHFLIIDEDTLPYEQVITWFKAPESEAEEFSASYGEESFNLNNLEEMKVDKDSADRGFNYYMENAVSYIELNGEKGRAIVTGSRPYEIEFTYKAGQISGLTCDCYCTGACKHEFAVMLQLRETLNLIDNEYGDAFELKYKAIISKSMFLDFVIGAKTRGSFNIEI